MLKDILNEEYEKRNKENELISDKPDPLMIARKLKEDMAILTCAFFSYGRASSIVKFIESLPFDMFDRVVSEKTIRDRLKGYKYRFQSEEDIVQWFLLVQKIRILSKKEQRKNSNRNPKESYLQNLFLKSYFKNNSVIEAIYETTSFFYSLTDYRSKGFSFLIGSEIPTNSSLKRWNMFLRWMVRKDNLDLGYWTEIQTSDLIIPLDTHLYNLGKKMGLIERKSYDLKAAIEMTNSLKEFDESDPIKYDFAIYRLGQEGKFN